MKRPSILSNLCEMSSLEKFSIVFLLRNTHRRAEISLSHELVICNHCYLSTQIIYHIMIMKNFQFNIYSSINSTPFNIEQHHHYPN